MLLVSFPLTIPYADVAVSGDARFPVLLHGYIVDFA